MNWRITRPNPPCEMCGFGGDSEGPWIMLRARYCYDCEINHILCEQCPENFDLNNPEARPNKPLRRCPRSPEIQVLLAIMAREA